MRTNYCIRTLKIVPVNLCFFWCDLTSIRNVITFVETVASRHKNNFVWFLNNIKQFLNKNEVINTEERSNQHRIVDSGVVSLSISDHSLIYCVLKAGVPKATSRTIEYRSFKGFDENAFIQNVKMFRGTLLTMRAMSTTQSWLGTNYLPKLWILMHQLKSVE